MKKYGEVSQDGHSSMGDKLPFFFQYTTGKCGLPKDKPWCGTVTYFSFYNF